MFVDKPATKLNDQVRQERSYKKLNVCQQIFRLPGK